MNPQPDLRNRAAKRAKGDDYRKPFFERLGIKMLFVDSYEEIYENAAWEQ